MSIKAEIYSYRAPAMSMLPRTINISFPLLLKSNQTRILDIAVECCAQNLRNKSKRHENQIRKSSDFYFRFEREMPESGALQSRLDIVELHNPRFATNFIQIQKPPTQKTTRINGVSLSALSHVPCQPTVWPLDFCTISLFSPFANQLKFKRCRR